MPKKKNWSKSLENFEESLAIYIKVQNDEQVSATNEYIRDVQETLDAQCPTSASKRG